MSKVAVQCFFGSLFIRVSVLDSGHRLKCIILPGTPCLAMFAQRSSKLESEDGAEGKKSNEIRARAGEEQKRPQMNICCRHEI